MKEGQLVVFLVKPDEVSSLAQGLPLTFRPTDGTPFLIMLDVPLLPVMNGRPPDALMEQPIKPIKEHPNRTYHCGLCNGREFANQSAYMRHQIKAHRGGRVKNGIRKKKHA